MSKSLVIVESPSKARTIAGYLGDDYIVESSIGHVRDLPRNAKDVPEAYKKEKWARLGIDTDNDFKPLYIVSPEKKDQVRKLKALLKESDELLLATDEDREGEAIAWHLLEVLNPKVPVKRMVFHEITPEAIGRAIDNPRDLDRHLVDAQEARRMLDRLYGYEVSPVLWKKVKPRISAGRVQSVATRVIVERERLRMAFVSANYWDLKGTFDSVKGDKPFQAMLLELDGQRIASGKDFNSEGRLAKDGMVHLDAGTSTALAETLDGRPATVKSREAKPYRRRPSAPFITSTYQQEAGRKLRMSSAQAMRVAQGLYEGGFITYMRTDSTTLSETAVAAARSQIEARYGKDYLPDEPRTYKSKVKNAQEAHEAIRPAGDLFRTPEQVQSELSRQQLQVYELIWQRTVASQMTDATGETVTLRLDVTSTEDRTATFSTSGTVITHKGFLSAYEAAKEEDSAEEEVTEQLLPPLEQGDTATLTTSEPAGHDTQPPARFTEASLIKKLEELGVGRPSTYASIMGTIQDRGYARKRGSAMVPTFLAFAVVTLLEEHFPDLVDYAFTAQMELDLDDIAGGSAEAIPYLSKFYFGASSAALANEHGLKSKVETRLGEIDARAVNSIPLGADADGVPIIARVGKFGPYLERGEDRASVPEDLAPDELTIDKAIELIDAPKDDRILGVHPETGLDVELKAGRFGPYVQMGEHDDETDTKPKTASLFSDMDPQEITLEDALKLMSLPRVIGNHPEDGAEITAQNGRYGPYIKKGTDSRTIESEDLIFTMTLDRAVAIFAEPKRRGTAKPPLREMGIDPATELPVVMKEGRFGIYVTDGVDNASLRKGDDMEEMTIERASELLGERRAAGPTTKKKASKKKVASKKKASKKKAASKKKVAAKKKPAAKKPAAANKTAPKKRSASDTDDAAAPAD